MSNQSEKILHNIAFMKTWYSEKATTLANICIGYMLSFEKIPEIYNPLLQITSLFK